MPSTLGIIQARMSSTRLPGKILSPIGSQPLLAVLYERLHYAGVDEWWLATSREPSDEMTAAWGGQLGLHVFRGDMEDVLSRYAEIIRRRRPDWIVRITADDPFVDAAVVNLLLVQAARVSPDSSVVAEGPERRFPLGYVPQVARAGAILESEPVIPAEATYHRTHVLSWHYEKGAVVPFCPPSDWPPRPDWRWTVDTPLDLTMAQEAFAIFGEHWATIHYPQMVALLDTRPDVVSVNLGVRQKHLSEA